MTSIAARMRGVSYQRQLSRLAAPLLIATGILVVIPAVMTLALAFTHYDALHAPSWAGVSNFRRMFSDDVFQTALWNSIIFVVMAVPLRVGGALGLALLYERRRRGTGTFRAAAYLPTVIPDISYALVWLFILNPIYGPLNLALEAIGLPITQFLLSAWGSRLSIVLMTTFQIGEGFIVALAARNDIPQELYELATVDGAGPVWTFRRVTLPLMAPALVLLAARDIVFSFQANFVPAFIVTEGGPLYATTFLPLHTYRNAFEFFRFGYASAMTLAMYAVTAAMVGIQLFVVRRWRSAFTS
jgi:multiple sugar transport system permease protein